MKLLLVGASGLVGGHVLKLALLDPRISQVVAPSRRALSVHAKLQNPIVDFENLPEDASWWQGIDAVICTLGTTMKAAGSIEIFYRVDHDYPLAFAKLAQRHGTTTYVLNSAIGANASSRFFYNQVKGRLEQDLAALGFRSLTAVRPSVIGGQRSEFRFRESILVTILAGLKPVLPRRWRINTASHIASTLIEEAINPTPGINVVGADRLLA
ncbi:NAD(P)H-binding protein [Herbaspirillum lusitanum]|uniref:NAD(P)H-binding protein n=1 Tax=Herbaspirillum lusitanum TaxID=213312 RepID=UPI000A057E04|nr:NAD(P)H-binding protein [Herbaspirillum lusitanum]